MNETQYWEAQWLINELTDLDDTGMAGITAEEEACLDFLLSLQNIRGEVAEIVDAIL